MNPWVTDAAWSLDGRRLLVPAVLDGLVRVFEGGVLVDELKRPGGGRLEWTKPSGIAAVDDGYIVSERSQHLIWLNHALEPFDGLFLDRRAAIDTVAEIALFQWAATPHGQIFMVADVKRDDGGWVPGYHSLELGTESSLQTHLVTKVEDDDRRFYTRAIPMVAIAAGKGYFLRLEREPYIFAADRPSASLSAFPKRYRQIPVMPPDQGFGSFRQEMETLARATMPAGLFGRGDRLYLLTREPRQEGGARWQLHAIDPVADRLDHVIELPTRASFLVVAPGPEQWAVLELGPYRDPMPQQDLDSLLLLPSSWVDDAASPLAAGHAGEAVRCSRATHTSRDSGE